MTTIALDSAAIRAKAIVMNYRQAKRLVKQELILQGIKTKRLDIDACVREVLNACNKQEHINANPTYPKHWAE